VLDEESVDISVVVPIAHGTEELEAVAIVDIARRAGFRVRIAGESENIICSRGVRIAPDILWSQLDDSERYDAVVLPGGAEGTERLLQSDEIGYLVRSHAAEGALIGAICAAPLVLHHLGILPQHCALTSHPSVADQLQQYDYRTDRVVQSGRIITSRGAGTAVEFALAIVAALTDEQHARRIADRILAL
jgi:4-methyl-5(b-hydroxyethyl)-thiazole monophosphate biosynthesis